MRVSFFDRSMVLAAVLAASSLSSGACKSSRKANTADGTILTPYLAIGDTLADDEIEGIDRLGAQVVEAAQARTDEPGVGEILAAAGRLGASDIATARLAYRKMSEGVITYLDAHPKQREGLLLIHCPMAFTNEGGYWVQKAGEIENPYEGAMMLRCGAKIAWQDHRRGAPPAGDAKLEGMKP